MLAKAIFMLAGANPICPGTNSIFHPPFSKRFQQPAQRVAGFAIFTYKTNRRMHKNNNTLPALQPQQIFRIISFEYIDSISITNGEAFRQKLLQQFAAQMPRDLESLQMAWLRADATALKAAAHHLKTTVSFMGFYEPLRPSLDFLQHLETIHLQDEWLKTELQKVLEVCGEALAEVSHYLEKTALISK